MAKAKSLEDFNLSVSRVKQDYLDQKIKYNWNYTFKQEDHESVIYFMITNHFQATKIIFDKESNFIVEKDIYTIDVKTMQELQEKL
jgi:hypothetical protein